MDIKQESNGSATWYSDTEGLSLWHIGGPKSPASGGSSVNSGFTYRAPFTLKIPLTSGNVGTAQGASILNPYGADVMIGLTKVLTTTAQTLTLTVSVGTGSNNSIFGNNLIDTARVETAGIVTNIDDKGSAGKGRQVWTSGQFITATLFNNTANTFVGTLYVTIEKE